MLFGYANESKSHSKGKRATRARKERGQSEHERGRGEREELEVTWKYWEFYLEKSLFFNFKTSVRKSGIFRIFFIKDTLFKIKNKKLTLSFKNTLPFSPVLNL